MFQVGIEPGTCRTEGERHNHYTTEECVELQKNWIYLLMNETMSIMPNQYFVLNVSTMTQVIIVQRIVSSIDISNTRLPSAYTYFYKEPSTLTGASGFLKNFFCFLLFYKTIGYCNLLLLVPKLSHGFLIKIIPYKKKRVFIYKNI